MDPRTHLVLEGLEILSILTIMGLAGVLLSQIHRQAVTVGSLAATVGALAQQVGDLPCHRDMEKIDELLVTQQVMLRRLERIERRLPHGAN